MSRAVLSIGSNLGDRLGYLRRAVDGFRPWLVAVSPVYETAPWGGVEQQDFLNAVLVVDDAEAGPRAWLRRAQDAELAAGRERTVHWGQRTLDVDVIVVDDVVSCEAELTLPHPYAAQRAFVLVPWRDVDPGARLGGRTPDEWLATLPPDEVAGVRARPDLRLEVS
jgi:2-amino-4-hydroxy-6-hydroxymethyldihydropteridine diphosphokinase